MTRESEKREVTILLTSLFTLLSVVLEAQVTYKGLEIAVTGVERSDTVALRDCPPGANSIRGTTKPGEEFAIVQLAFTVTNAFKETLVPKPVLVAADGKTFNTAMAFVDPGSQPRYICDFAFRVPAGTALGQIRIDTATLDLSAFQK